MARKPSGDKTSRIVGLGLLAPGLLAICTLGCRSEKPLTSEADTAPPALPAPAKAPAKAPAEASAARSPAPAPPRPPCPRYRAPASQGTLENARLTEISGLGVTSAAAGTFWVHNDSGDEARTYLLSARAEWLATYRLLGIDKPSDIEDLAVVRRGEQTTLYLGDIGDNARSRTDGILIHRFVEPELPARADSVPPNRERPTGPVATFHLRYPDGPHDAEALLVDPSSETVVIVTKPLLGDAEVYQKQGPLADGTLALAGRLTEPLTGTIIQLVTGADMTRAGDYLALRTYDSIFLFPRAAGQSMAEALLAPACPVPAPPEKQGEAIALLDRPGRAPAVATMSEGEVTALWLIEPE